MAAKATVLVVDDDEAVRASYAAILAAGRCDAQMAPDGAEALAAMAQRPYDVVLLDLRMPGADGMSVLKDIKARWPESEVVVITGYPSLESAKEAVRLGAYDYLSKPVGPGEVIAATQGALRRKQFALRGQPAR